MLLYKAVPTKLRVFPFPVIAGARKINGISMMLETFQAISMSLSHPRQTLPLLEFTKSSRQLEPALGGSFTFFHTNHKGPEFERHMAKLDLDHFLSSFSQRAEPKIAWTDASVTFSERRLSTFKSKGTASRLSHFSHLASPNPQKQNLGQKGTLNWQLLRYFFRHNRPLECR